MSASDNPEFDRLSARLFGNPNRELRGFHVSWGDKAHELSREEACKALNDSLDRVEAGQTVSGPPVSRRKPTDVRTFLSQIDSETQT